MSGSWPDWWQWELELSGHLRRMSDREFNEADLRAMMADARGYHGDVEPGRHAVSTRWQGKVWEVIVEPDPALRRLVVVTAYPVK